MGLDRRAPHEKVYNNPPCPKCGHAKTSHSREGCTDVINVQLLTPCTCKVKYTEIKEK